MICKEKHIRTNDNCDKPKIKILEVTRVGTHNIQEERI